MKNKFLLSAIATSILGLAVANIAVAAPTPGGTKMVNTVQAIDDVLPAIIKSADAQIASSGLGSQYLFLSSVVSNSNYISSIAQTSVTVSDVVSYSDAFKITLKGQDPVPRFLWNAVFTMTFDPNYITDIKPTAWTCAVSGTASPLNAIPAAQITQVASTGTINLLSGLYLTSDADNPAYTINCS